MLNDNKNGASLETLCLNQRIKVYQYTLVFVLCFINFHADHQLKREIDGVDERPERW